MKKKTPEDLDRAAVAKTTRTLIRLKHSLRADEEINTILPDRLDEFDAALSRGTIKELTLNIDDVLGGRDVPAG